jgi:hypothetical protein
MRSGIREEQVVGHPQFEILADPEFRQPIDVLLRSGCIYAPFGFERSRLHRLRRGGNRGGWGQQLIHPAPSQNSRTRAKK